MSRIQTDPHHHRFTITSIDTPDDPPPLPMTRRLTAAELDEALGDMRPRPTSRPAPGAGVIMVLAVAFVALAGVAVGWLIWGAM